MADTRKYNFWCTNCTCENKQHPKKQDFVIEATEEEKEQGFKCPNSDSEEPLKCLGYTPSWGLNKFDSLTPNQKQDVLLKRSKEHFKKNIKEEKYEKNKDLIRKFKA